MLDHLVDKLHFASLSHGRVIAQVVVIALSIIMYLLMKYSQETFRLRADIL